VERLLDTRKQATPARRFAMTANHQFQHLVIKLHALGARPLAEFLAELGGEYLIRTAIQSKLERYARLSPELLATTGADRFAANPIHLVQGDKS
jgi:hypothetical protein